MSNKEKLLWGLYGAALVLLFLMSSTDLIIKEKTAAVYPISIIVRQTTDEYYGNFKKGMDKAAEEYKGDVNFITLYTEHSQEQQLELFLREMRDGAGAIILEPVQGEKTVMALDEIKPSCPVVLLGTDSPEAYVSGAITADRYEMGKQLGEAVAKKLQPHQEIYLFTEGLDYGGNKETYGGFCSVLEERGFSCRLYEKRDSDTYRQAIEGTVYPGNEHIVVAALDASSLDETARILESSSVYRQHVEGLYGIGDTTAILSALDKGIIDGIVTYNQFNAGYLSVKRAVEAAEGIQARTSLQLEHFYLEQEDLRKKEYEKMLYPIE